MLIGFIIRSGVLVGAVYYSRKLGVWGTPSESEELYNTLKESVRPHAHELKSKLPFELPSLPQTGEVRFLAKHYYNQGVKGTFQFLEMAPCYTGQLVKQVEDVYHNFAKPPAVTDDTDPKKK